MKVSHTALEYPLVIKQVDEFLVFSVPDLGFTFTENLPSGGRLNKDYVTKIALKLAETWIKVQSHLKNRALSRIETKDPSKLRGSISLGDKELLSAPDFANEVGVHPNTIRRMADRGQIKFKKTPGGHRKFLRAHVEEIKRTLENTKGRIRK